MDIKINQRQISFGDKYDIYVDDKHSFFASKPPFQILSRIKLFSYDNSLTPIFVIKRKLSWPKAYYLIVKSPTEIFEFKSGDSYSSFFTCNYNLDTYKIYGHDKRQYSIYKNDLQIAWWRKKEITWFKGDHYIITADGDCNQELIIVFCLIIDNFRYAANGDIYSNSPIDIVVEERKFDPFWLPKP